MPNSLADLQNYEMLILSNVSATALTNRQMEIARAYVQDLGGGLAMLGRPGEYPFTRGIHPLMYRKQPWTMRQYTGFGNAADTNRRFKYLIDQGQTGISTDFDMPTLMGYDSDHPMSDGEVGREGVAIDTLAAQREARRCLQRCCARLAPPRRRPSRPRARSR